jgi:DNA-directed RNA polymerase subunit beta'
MIYRKDSKKILNTHHIPYGSILFVKDGQEIKKGDLISKWDPFNNVMVSTVSGKAEFIDIINNITSKDETDEQTGFKEKVIILTKDKKKMPAIQIVTKGNVEPVNYNLPVGAHIVIQNGQEVKPGQVIAKIPRQLGKLKDITGGLPRVTELVEARNPSNPAVVTEIDGVVSFGGIKRGNQEVIVESKDGMKKKYLIKLSKHILVQENDYVKAGMPLSDGAITPSDILAIKGPQAVQEYIVNEIQEVYRLQGIKINDKHVEVIVRQMMSKVLITDQGDTSLLEGESVDKLEFMQENDRLYEKYVITEAGDSTVLKLGQIVSLRKIREENSNLKRNDKAVVDYREAVTATASPLLQGITRASLSTYSWISAASFQETTKVLSTAAISAKQDFLEGLKENVIVGHKIPAGTGVPEFNNMNVGSREDYDRLQSSRAEVLDSEI